MEEKVKTRKVMRSSENGEFVSRATAEASPNTTYQDTVPTGQPDTGVRAEVMALLDSLEQEGYELEEVEILNGNDIKSISKKMRVTISVPVELTFSKPDVVLDDTPTEESTP